jgi:hypothetical protein
MLVVGKSTMCEILHDFVQAMNVLLRTKISWPPGQRLLDIMKYFQDLYGLPTITKHVVGAEYYYFKNGGYTLNCQTVVDSRKRFLDLYQGMPESTNDA